MARAGGVCVRLVLVSLLLLPAAYPAAGTTAVAVAVAARGPVEGAVRARAPTLRLRGGGDAVRAPAVLQKAASKVETLAAEEAKPDLKRHPSRLVLNEHGNMSSATLPFILNKLSIERVAKPWVMLGFGPGLEIEMALIR